MSSQFTPAVVTSDHIVGYLNTLHQEYGAEVDYLSDVMQWAAANWATNLLVLGDQPLSEATLAPHIEQFRKRCIQFAKHRGIPIEGLTDVIV